MEEEPLFHIYLISKQTSKIGIIDHIGARFLNIEAT
jgi:hypothetical protein